MNALIFSAVPSLDSTDKSVCATRILPYLRKSCYREAGVEQTLLSVLSQDAATAVANRTVAHLFTASARGAAFAAAMKRLSSPPTLAVAGWLL